MAAQFAYTTWQWGTQNKVEFIKACKEVSSIGFRYFESVKPFFEIFKDDVEEFNLICAEFDLRPVSVYFHLDGTRENDIDDLYAKIPFLEKTGINKITIQPKGCFGRTANDDELVEAAKTITEMGQICKKYGIIPSVHNHYNTVCMVERDIDFIMQNTDPSEVFYCPDTAHLLSGSCNPVEIVERYKDRVRFTHLKDLKDPKDLQSAGMEQGKEVYTNFVELGQGSVNFKGVFDALKSANYDGYLCAELDRSRFNNKISCEINMEFLKANW